MIEAIKVRLRAYELIEGIVKELPAGKCEAGFYSIQSIVELAQSIEKDIANQEI